MANIPGKITVFALGSGNFGANRSMAEGMAFVRKLSLTMAYALSCFLAIQLIATAANATAIPSTPAQPSGPSGGAVGNSLTYSTSTTPSVSNIKYGWDWDGDGTVDEWSDAMPGGSTDTRSHVWTAIGVYSVQVKVLDLNMSLYSGWSAAKVVTIDVPASKDDSLYFFPHPLKCPGGNAVFKMEKPGTATLQIINMRGQVVKEITRVLSSSAGVGVPISCGDVKNGVYLIQGERKYDDGTTSRLKPYKLVVTGGR